MGTAVEVSKDVGAADGVKLEGTSVGCLDGAKVEVGRGVVFGASVGSLVGDGDGFPVTLSVGLKVFVGANVGPGVIFAVGSKVGCTKHTPLRH